MSNTTTQNTEIAKEIFRQLQASKVNGFPFLAYTGLKPQIFSATELYLKAPRNPNKVKNILVSYSHARDTYTVLFNGSQRHEDIYADVLAEMIVREMGVN